MLFEYFARRRRLKLLAQPLPDDWHTWLHEDMPIYRQLDPAQRQRLMDIARVIIAEKQWFGRGMTLTPRIKLCIAAQAALLLLGFEHHDYFANVSEIIVDAHGWDITEYDGDLEFQMPVSGTAWEDRGPIELAWDHTRSGAMNLQDGQNVVLHEFAHKLDQLDGWSDGTPPLADREKFDQWNRLMEKHYDSLMRKARSGRRIPIDDYGLTDPAEFFAVSTEVFFETPRTLQRDLPELYDLLSDFYRQDPASWKSES